MPKVKFDIPRKAFRVQPYKGIIKKLATERGVTSATIWRQIHGPCQNIEVIEAVLNEMRRRDAVIAEVQQRAQASLERAGVAA